MYLYLFKSNLVIRKIYVAKRKKRVILMVFRFINLVIFIFLANCTGSDQLPFSTEIELTCRPQIARKEK